MRLLGLLDRILALLKGWRGLAEQPNRDERMVLLARFSKASEAEMVRELLSQNDIACVVQG